MNVNLKKELLEHLLGFVSRHKQKLFDEVAAQRTRHITVALEDVYQSQNASAVLRTCDCLGIQDVHIIENRYEYTLNPDVTLGSNQWLNLYKYKSGENNTLRCIEELKEQGYRVVATTPQQKGRMPADLGAESKLALMFGTEEKGLSGIALNNADEFVSIPMCGFTGSLNLSVSAAICLYELMNKLKKSDIDWQLNEEEIINIKLHWVRQAVKKPHLIENEFLKNKTQ